MQIIDSIKLTTIYDNNLAKDGLDYGFGFSCLLEWTDTKIIFDTGGNKTSFFANIKRLGIDLRTITQIVFSHQHWDHTAGFGEVIAALPRGCQIYLPHQFDAKLVRQIPPDLQLFQIKNVMTIMPGVTSYVLRGTSCLIKECFSVYEQFLLINSQNGLIILTGCAHPGITKILHKVRAEHQQPVHFIIGGFHLHRSWQTTIQRVINDFNQAEVQNIAPCHCSGEKALRLFEAQFVNEVHRIGTGSQLLI